MELLSSGQLKAGAVGAAVAIVAVVVIVASVCTETIVVVSLSKALIVATWDVLVFGYRGLLSYKTDLGRVCDCCSFCRTSICLAIAGT